MPTLSIIIPTLGRPLLGKILRELAAQLGPLDEVLVVGDGPQPTAESIVAGTDPRIRYLEGEQDHCWGHPQRNWAMARAKGTHLASFDDDDSLMPGALEIMRSAASRAQDRPHLFKIRYRGEVIWKERALACGNVSTQMFLVPKVRGRLGEWGARYEGDLDFIRSTVTLYPRGPRSIIWCNEVIAHHGLSGNDPRSLVSEELP